MTHTVQIWKLFYAGAPAATPFAPDVAFVPLGLKSSRNSMKTTSAPADGTSQIECQLCVTLRHSCAAAAASVHDGFGVA
jgi:hypothetical protein